ncbi:MAG: PilZ domain-containing protein [Deltaproteobacteria bacterium]|nr:PilZ domain-containing protein [Deltaproteobacteria bacterium]MCB9786624.1 PilZ domain-containing protein [Deltaproteobacteria bacterium]
MSGNYRETPVVRQRSFRMAVRLSGPQHHVDGHTVDISSVGSFVACEPSFRIGEEVRVQILLAEGRVADLTLRAVVTRRVERRNDDDPAVGLGLTWTSALSKASPLPLKHFLQHILQIVAPPIEASGDLYWYTFRQRAPEAPPDSRNVRPSSSLSRLREAFGRPVRVPIASSSTGATPDAPPAPRRQVERKVRVVTSRHAVRREPESTRTQPLPWGTGARPDLARPSPPPGPPAPQSPPPQPPAPSPPPAARPSGATANAAPQHSAAAPAAPVTPPEDERRRRPRVDVSTPVTYFLGRESHLGRSVNVSRAGLYVETDGPLPKIGDRVNIRLPVLHAGRHHVVMLTTRIVRYRGPGDRQTVRPGFAADYQVVDELGVPGIFSHFLRTRMEDADTGE